MKCTILAIFLAVIGVGIVGCQKFITMKTEYRNDQLTFSFNGAPKNRTIKIYNFELFQEECISDCVYWNVMNKEDESGALNHILLDGRYVVYGQEFPDMDLRTAAKKLVSGKYIASGTASIKAGSGGQTFYHTFILDEGVGGKLFVRDQ